MWIDPAGSDENHKRAAVSRNMGNVWQRNGSFAPLTNIIDLNIITWTRGSPVPLYDFNVIGNLKFFRKATDM